MIIAKFRKNKKYHLDDVYHYLSLIPSECYHQDDIGDSEISNNTAGEEIIFKKNVTLKIEIIIKD